MAYSDYKFKKLEKRDEKLVVLANEVINSFIGTKDVLYSKSFDKTIPLFDYLDNYRLKFDTGDYEYNRAYSGAMKYNIQKSKWEWLCKTRCHDNYNMFEVVAITLCNCILDKRNESGY